MVNIINKGTDFSVKLQLVDCQNRLILPQNTQSMQLTLFTTDENSPIYNTVIDANGNVYINKTDYEHLTSGVLKYKVNVSFESDYYSDNNKELQFVGETNIYIK